MLLLHPDKVDMDRVINHPPAQLTSYDVFPEDPTRTPASGCHSSATGATAAKGQLLLDAVTRAVSDALISELHLPLPVASRKAN